MRLIQVRVLLIGRKGARKRNRSLLESTTAIGLVKAGLGLRYQPTLQTAENWGFSLDGEGSSEE